ncbi:MAG: hypothetical protein JNK02_15955 [Planctomycetes bacterium]|nr:hypothetical protein [Planctomycetota bacterium]
MNTTALLSILSVLLLGEVADAAIFRDRGTTLTIECPPTGKVFCGTPTTPDFTGEATATSNCPGQVVITYTDAPALPGANCLARRFNNVILRTWTATDACGNTASCTQTIDVVRQDWSLDIKPTSCPNPIQVGSNGGNAAVMIALLGKATQNVLDVDPASVAIWREDCLAGPVYPVSYGYEDVAAPWQRDVRCGCTTQGPDGFVDLRLRFERAQLVQGLGLANLPQGSTHRLVLTARTFSGCELVASDCVRIQ